MNNRTMRIILPTFTYGGLIFGALMYLVMNYILSHSYGLTLQSVRPFIVAGVMSTTLALLSGIVVICSAKVNGYYSLRTVGTINLTISGSIGI